jgi:hypothetical protein
MLNWDMVSLLKIHESSPDYNQIPYKASLTQSPEEHSGRQRQVARTPDFAPPVPFRELGFCVFALKAPSMVVL